MTLKESWDNCIEMWEWIVSQLPDDWVCKPWEYRITNLKQQWAREHGGTTCYFCQYIEDHTSDCRFCPPTLIDPMFFCTRSEYNYSLQPREFLTKIKELFKEYQNDTARQ